MSVPPHNTRFSRNWCSAIFTPMDQSPIGEEAPMYDLYADYRLTGAFEVHQTARLVARYHYIEAQLMRVAAGKLAELPEWEVKCLLGRHLWQDSLHADGWLARLIDLRWPRRAPLSPGEPMRRLMALLDAAPDSSAYLIAVYRQIKPRLLAAYTSHRAACAPLADEPTFELLGRFIAEEEAQVRQGLALLDTFPTVARTGAAEYEAEINTACEAVGSFVDPATAAEREASGSFEGQAVRSAPAIAARDERFRFGEHAADQPPADAHELALVMAHRDADNEMHAAELLGRNLYEHPEMPWEYHVDTARQLWDEVRHAVLYQRYLEQLGGRLGDFPIIPGNYAYRIGLGFLHRLYDLHLRGEKLGMADLIRYREEARSAGDTGYVLLNDFVHADEVPHVKNGRWLHWVLKDDTEAFRRIERETMQIRAAYERDHADDPIIQAYTGLVPALLDEEN
jgi:uncharacterized ferritin-like protein (DUF455 family)